MYLTCNEVVDKYEWLPMGGLRHLIHNKEKNGFKDVMIRIGRKILIDESRFISWIESQRIKD